MGENKRIFLTGALIAGLLLLTPFYLQLIGVQEQEPDGSTVENKSSQISESSLDSSSEKNNVNSNGSSKNSNQNLSFPAEDGTPESQAFRVITETLNLVINSAGGGSIHQASLVSENIADGYKYVGGYNDEDVYVDDRNVSLILNNSKNCAPCLASIESDDETLFYNLPFEIISVNDSPFVDSKDDSLKKYFVRGNDSLVVKMSTEMSGIQINKTTTFFGGGYEISHSFEVGPDGSVFTGALQDDDPFYVAWLGGLRHAEKDHFFELSQYTGSYVGQEKEALDYFYNTDDDSKTNFYNGRTDWTAIRNKYFVNAFISPLSGNVASGGFLAAQSYETAAFRVVPEYSMGLKFKGSAPMSINQFLGPLDVDYISETNTYLDRIMNFGWLPIQPFSRSVLWLLKKTHALGLNYGVILILFAFLIRFVTGPLSKKSFTSSQNMQKIQPKIKKIQTKYKDDSQRMNREVMKLYSESGVNPLGGCWPMLIQMPLLFSLFIVFRSTIEFRGAPFMLWINNLSQPDAVYDLGFSIPIYGQYVAILPIFLGVSMFLSQRLSMQTMDPKQKPMMYIMSGFFFLLFNAFPSGLNLYYMAYNLLNYHQQLSLRKK